MKKHILKFTLLLFCFQAVAQKDNIIVLVDISGSITKYNKNPITAAGAIADVIEGRSVTNSDYEFKDAKGGSIKEPLTETGKRIMIIPFGDKSTDYNSRNESPQALNSLNDARDFLTRRFPSSYPDQKTYRELALARTAEMAKRNGLSSYWLFIASDVTGDDFAGQAADYDKEQQDVIDSYKSPTNKIDETKLGFIKYRFNNTYKIEIYRIALVNYTPPPSSTGTTTNPPVVDTTQRTCKISLSSFAGGTGSKPRVVDKVPFSLSWSCDCPNITPFKVIVSGINGTKVDNALRSKIYTSTSAQYNLGDGKYRIVVQADGATSDSTTIEVKTGIGGLFWVILGVIAAVAGGYYFYSKRGEQKPFENSKPKPRGDSKTVFDN